MVSIIRQAIIDGWIKPDEILTAVEEAGMLPPSNGKLTTNYQDMGAMPDHSWDEE